MKFSVLQKPAYSYVFFALILLFFGYTYYEHFITRLPFGTHEWAQADRLSLAYYFYDHGMNFLLPGTLNVSSVDGVAGVEFPIQAYIAAALAKIFGRGSMATSFRITDIFIAITGLFFLFRIGFKATGDFLFSILPPLFIFCAPVYIFYSGNFLPDPAGASITFIAFYYLSEYIRGNSKRRNLFATIFFLTLASLIKTSAGLYLSGTLGYLLLNSLLTPGTGKAKKALVICAYGIVSCGILLSWYLYAQYLSKTYQNYIFVMAARPFDNWDEFSFFIDFSFKWVNVNEYLLLPQYILLLIIGSLGLTFMRMQKLPEYRAQKQLAGIYLLGALAMFYLLGHQLVVHDYYIIAIFMPFFAWLLVFAMIAIRRQLTEPVPVRIVRRIVFIVVLVCFFMADHHSYRRNNPEYFLFSNGFASQWMENGDKFLDELHIPADEKIGVLCDDSPNLGLVYFNRYGYNLARDVWGSSTNATLGYMLKHNIHILVCSKKNVKLLLAAESNFFDAYEKLGEKDKKVVFRLNKQ